MHSRFASLRLRAALRLTISYLTAILLGAFLSLPLLWIVMTAFKPTSLVLTMPPTWVFGPTVEHFRAVFARPEFWSALSNTAIVTVATMTVTLSVGTLAAYGMARHRAGGAPLIYTTLAIRALPPIVMGLPMFVLFTQLGLIDTLPGLTVAYTAFMLPNTIWLMLGFFQAVPKSLEEAALVDGCTRFGAFLRIALPLAKPGLVVTGFYNAVGAWNHFFFGPDAFDVECAHAAGLCRPADRRIFHSLGRGVGDRHGVGSAAGRVGDHDAEASGGRADARRRQGLRRLTREAIMKDFTTRLQSLTAEPSKDTGDDAIRRGRVARTRDEMMDQGARLNDTLSSEAEGCRGIARAVAERGVTRIVIAGCGDSWFAAIGARLAMERATGLVVEPAQAFDWAHFAGDTADAQTLVVGISSGGSTPAVLAALDSGKRRGAMAIGVSNTAGSKILTDYDGGLVVHATRKGWPTQSSTATIGLLIALGIEIGVAMGRDVARLESQRDELLSVGTAMDRVAQAFGCRRAGLG